jgi:hypothetical protein
MDRLNPSYFCKIILPENLPRAWIYLNVF